MNLLSSFSKLFSKSTKQQIKQQKEETNTLHLHQFSQIPYEHLPTLKQFIFECLSEDEKNILFTISKSIPSQISKRNQNSNINNLNDKDSSKQSEIEINSINSTEDDVSIVSIASETKEEGLNLSGFDNISIPEINENERNVIFKTIVEHPELFELQGSLYPHYQLVNENKVQIIEICPEDAFESMFFRELGNKKSIFDNLITLRKYYQEKEKELKVKCDEILLNKILSKVTDKNQSIFQTKEKKLILRRQQAIIIIEMYITLFESLFDETLKMNFKELLEKLQKWTPKEKVIINKKPVSMKEMILRTNRKNNPNKIDLTTSKSMKDMIKRTLEKGFVRTEEEMKEFQLQIKNQIDSERESVKNIHIPMEISFVKISRRTNTNISLLSLKVEYLARQLFLYQMQVLKKCTIGDIYVYINGNHIYENPFREFEDMLRNISALFQSLTSLDDEQSLLDIIDLSYECLNKKYYNMADIIFNSLPGTESQINEIINKKSYKLYSTKYKELSSYFGKNKTQNCFIENDELKMIPIKQLKAESSKANKKIDIELNEMKEEKSDNSDAKKFKLLKTLSIGLYDIYRIIQHPTSEQVHPILCYFFDTIKENICFKRFDKKVQNLTNIEIIKFIDKLKSSEMPYIDLASEPPCQYYRNDMIEEYNYIIGLKSINKSINNNIIIKGDVMVMKDGTLIGFSKEGKTIMKYKPINIEKAQSRYCFISYESGVKFISNKDLHSNETSTQEDKNYALFVSNNFDTKHFTFSQTPLKTSKIESRWISNDSRMIIFENKTVQFIFGNLNSTSTKEVHQISYFFNTHKNEIIVSMSNGEIYNEKKIEGDDIFVKLNKYKQEIEIIDDDFDNNIKKMTHFITTYMNYETE